MANEAIKSEKLGVGWKTGAWTLAYTAGASWLLPEG